MGMTKRARLPTAVGVGVGVAKAGAPVFVDVRRSRLPALSHPRLTQPNAPAIACWPRTRAQSKVLREFYSIQPESGTTYGNKHRNGSIARGVRIPPGAPRHLCRTQDQVAPPICTRKESSTQSTPERRMAAGVSAPPGPCICWICVQAYHGKPRQRPVLSLPDTARWLGTQRRSCL
jgi:hypothetical protein